MQPTELLEVLARQVREMAKTETVVGDPIVIGDTTIVPISRVMVGFGGGSGSGDVNEGGKGEQVGGSGGGGGGGVRIEPAAFIVKRGSDVSVMAAPGKRGALAEMFEQVPDLVEKVVGAAMSKGNDADKKGKDKDKDKEKDDPTSEGTGEDSEKHGQAEGAERPWNQR